MQNILRSNFAFCDMKTKKERLQQLIHYYSNGKPTAFAKMLGVSPSTVSSWIARDSFDYDLIFAKCENVSPEWLLTGKGDMLKPERDTDEIPRHQLSASHHKVINNKGIEQDLEVDRSKTRPRIPLEAAAGSLSIVTQSVSQGDCEMLPLIARIPDYDFTIMVKGDSMEPGFLSGDEVACRMIRERSFIQWGQPHVIDSYDGIVLKRIHDKGDKILCTSDNPAYGDFYIPKTDIYNLARVVGLIRQY